MIALFGKRNVCRTMTSCIETATKKLPYTNDLRDKIVGNYT